MPTRYIELAERGPRFPISLNLNFYSLVNTAMRRATAVSGDAAPAGGGVNAGAGAAAVEGAVNSNAMPSSGAAPRWPASAFFRWEDDAGPRDAWDALPFPPGGPGVLGRLRAAVAGSKLFRYERSAPAPALSAELNLGSVSRLLPLKEDRDVEKVIQAWQLPPCPGGVLALAIQRGGGDGVVAGLSNAFPIDAWACVLDAMEFCRCGMGSIGCFMFLSPW